MRRLLLLSALALVGCRPWTRPLQSVLPVPPGEAEALAIVAEVYGEPRLRTNVFVQYLPPDCDANGAPGYTTSLKKLCVRASVAAGMPRKDTIQLNVAWGSASTYAASGFPEGAFEAFERIKYGMEDIYHTTPRWTSGIAQRLIDEARRRLISTEVGSR